MVSLMRCTKSATPHWRPTASISPKPRYAYKCPSITHTLSDVILAQTEVFVAPKPNSADAVIAWLAEYGISTTNLSPFGDWLGITVNVSTANELLNADYSSFAFGSAGKTTFRTLQYSIPVGLQDYIDLIHPATR